MVCGGAVYDNTGLHFTQNEIHSSDRKCIESLAQRLEGAFARIEHLEDK